MNLHFLHSDSIVVSFGKYGDTDCRLVQVQKLRAVIAIVGHNDAVVVGDGNLVWSPALTWLVSTTTTKQIEKFTI